MKLSVCIFTYNHESYIAEAIEGALQQVTDFDFEIVIGEDCSTDGTREIVASYEAKFPEKVRPIYHPRNLGMMANNIFTILQGRGEYIALIDGDDYWTNPDKLQKQVDFLDANPEYSLCFHNSRVLRASAPEDESTCCGPGHKTIVSFTDVICDVHIPTSSTVFRRSALKAYPPKWFATLHAPDRPLFLMLTSNGPAYYFNETWAIYRKHATGSWTSQGYLSQWLIHLQIYRVMDKHYNHKYKKFFCRCESGVSYILATRLIQEKKTKRALCYIRKYIRVNKLFPPTADVYFKLLHFFALYLRSKVNFGKGELTQKKIGRKVQHSGT